MHDERQEEGARNAKNEHSFSILDRSLYRHRVQHRTVNTRLTGRSLTADRRKICAPRQSALTEEYRSGANVGEVKFLVIQA